MNQPARLENIVTDKGKVPVYATGVVDQPGRLQRRRPRRMWKALVPAQREIWSAAPQDEFLQAQDMMA